MNLSDELQPYLLCHVDPNGMRCATWTLSGGSQALALFLSQDSADRFRLGASLNEVWRSYCPNRHDLIEILRQSMKSGIAHAVLEPDQARAKSLFDLAAVLRSVEGETV